MSGRITETAPAFSRRHISGKLLHVAVDQADVGTFFKVPGKREWLTFFQLPSLGKPITYHPAYEEGSYGVMELRQDGFPIGYSVLSPKASPSFATTKEIFFCPSNTSPSGDMAKKWKSPLFVGTDKDDFFAYHLVAFGSGEDVFFVIPDNRMTLTTLRSGA